MSKLQNVDLKEMLRNKEIINFIKKNNIVNINQKGKIVCSMEIKKYCDSYVPINLIVGCHSFDLLAGSDYQTNVYAGVYIFYNIAGYKIYYPHPIYLFSKKTLGNNMMFPKKVNEEQLGLKNANSELVNKLENFINRFKSFYKYLFKVESVILYDDEYDFYRRKKSKSL